MSPKQILALIAIVLAVAFFLVENVAVLAVAIIATAIALLVP